MPQSNLYTRVPGCTQNILFEEFAAGTVLTDEYASLGAVFSTRSGGVQITDARPGDFAPISGDRVLGDPALPASEDGVVRIDFVVPGTDEPAAASFFSCYIIDAETNGATVTVFGVNGRVLETAFFNAGGAEQEYFESSHPVIGAVEIELGGSSDTAAVDNVCFSLPFSLQTPGLGFDVMASVDCGVQETFSFGNSVRVAVGDDAVLPVDVVVESDLSGTYLEETLGFGRETDSELFELGEGVHTLTVTAQDALGFISTTTVRVDVGGDDCNENCVPDADDIMAGTSSDVDGDGIPDECARPDFEATIMAIDARDDGVNDPRVNVTVTNLGPDIAVSGATVRVFEGDPSAGQIAGESSAPQLLAGESAVVSVLLGAGFAFTDGNDTPKALYAVVDPADEYNDPDTANNTNIAYRVRPGLNEAVSRVDRVLVVNVSGATYNQQGADLAETVRRAGGEVTYQNLSSNGQVAALLAANTYDQVWVFDLSSGGDSYPADWDAIAAWYLADSTRDIVCDGRMIASLWLGRWTTEGQAITNNYYFNLRSRGGGLVLGTDHGGGSGPTNGAGVFVTGINEINDRIGIGRFWGNPGGSVAGMPAVDNNPLRNLIADIGFDYGSVVGVNSQSSPSNAPTGFQDATNTAPGVTPLRRNFFTLAWHNGSTGGGAATPAISTTIQGGLGFSLLVETDCRVVPFGETATVSATASATAGIPLSFTWTSSLDGVVREAPAVQGFTDLFDTSALSEGTHTITVIAEDPSGFSPGSQIVVYVGADDCNANCVPDDQDIAADPSLDTNGDGVLDACELPDLIAGNFMGPARGFVGNPFSLTWETMNVGSTDAFGPWNEQVWLSSDAVIGNADDVLLTTITRSLPDDILTSNSSEFGSFEGVLPEVAGSYTLYVAVDTMNVVGESFGAIDGESNNTATFGPVDVQTISGQKLFVVDFEEFEEGTEVSDQYDTAELGVAFSIAGVAGGGLGSRPVIAEEGNPRTAFTGAGTDGPMASGVRGLTDPDRAPCLLRCEHGSRRGK
ncbi:MAG: hypothetical protein AAF235_08740, partial [Planctomycetota bacterium]